MTDKLGPATDNTRRPVVGERSVTIDSPTFVPSSSSGPREGLVAAVATVVVLLMLGAGWVAVQHGDRTPAAPQPTESGLCWNGALDRPAGCPKLEGQAALTWLFTPRPEFDSCQLDQGGGQGAGELETWNCRWDDIEAGVLISRWDKTRSAMSYYTYFAGAPRNVDINPGDDGGRVFSSLTPTEGGEPVYGFAYTSYPYSFLVMGPQEARDRAVSRIQPRAPAQIRL